MSSCGFSRDGFSSSFLSEEKASTTSSEYALRPRRMKSEISEKKLFRRSTKESQTLDELTMNKVRYDRIGMVGREREMNIVENCFTRMTENQERHMKELVFIKGYSGVGKTTIASNLKKNVAQTPNGVFVEGKFPLNSRDTPYSGIVVAMNKLFSAMKDTLGYEDEPKEDLLMTISKLLASELGSEAYLLAKIIPELRALLPSLLEGSNAEESIDFEAGQERWKYAFRTLIRVLGSRYSPIVLALDDLQWADTPSLEVIDYLISDSQNPNPLMIIGCFRSNEVDGSHNLSMKICQLKKKKELSKFNITDVEVSGFQEVEQVNQVIMAMLMIDDQDETYELAKICLRRTFGNPFFLIEFVTLLVAEGLLNFDLGLLEWVWDDKTVEDATMSTANVVSSLQGRMERLPRHLQLLLQYAACLGSSFTAFKLGIIWQEHGVKHVNLKSNGPNFINNSLAILEEKKFIECHGTNMYRWMHDKVQEAALSLGDVGQKIFQFEIGSILYYSLSETDLEESIFDVANLINKGRAKPGIEFATLNLRAGEKAKGISAFESAAKFVSSGIKFLPSDRWRNHHNLTLQLFILGSEMELAMGNVEMMETYNNEVLSQEGCSTLEKVPIYMAVAHKLSHVDMRYEETIKFCSDVLKKLDCKLMYSKALLPVQAISSLLITVRKMQNISMDSIKEQKHMTDPKKKAMMGLLYNIFIASYFLKKPYFQVLSTTKMVNLTLKYGKSSYSGVAFSALAIMVAASLRDMKTATQFAEKALMVQKMINCKYTEPITFFQSFFFVFVWTKPLQSCFMPCSEAYTTGIQSGNTKFASWIATILHVGLPFIFGAPLDTILLDIPFCVSFSEEVKNLDNHIVNRMFWQAMLNLSGESSETTRMEGLAFSFSEFDCMNIWLGIQFNLLQLVLFNFFGDFEQSAELSIRVGNSFEKTMPSIYLNIWEVYQRGLALYAMARITKKQRYLRPAKKIRKTMKTWVQKGNPNVRHYDAFFSAEQAAFDQDHQAADDHYKNAIVCARRFGYLHDTALFNERYADFLLNKEVPDEDGAKYRINQAIQYYTEWGAEAKVSRMKSAQKKLLAL